MYQPDSQNYQVSSVTIENANHSPGKTMAGEFKYNPSLDGLRGIAVLIVMFYHTGIFLPQSISPISGGFLGVDVFFVLSGFLITSVLLKEYAGFESINLRNFYLRRIYRLVPAYWLFLDILLLFGWLILPAAQTTIIYEGNKFLLAVTYLTNWNSAYGSLGGNLNHTWSLAIEEQFYILWPSFLCLLLFLKWRPRTIFAVTVGIIITVTIGRILRADGGTLIQILYYSTENRIDSLLIGCVASLILMWNLIPQPVFETKTFSALASFASLTCAFILFSYGETDRDVYRVYLSLFAVSVAIIILWISTHRTSLTNLFLGNAALRWTGRISYGLYLWHYLAFEISREILSSIVPQIIFGVILAFASAATSYYLLEIRFLKLKKGLEPDPVGS